jgi:Flp pilus assembly protein TadG
MFAWSINAYRDKRGVAAVEFAIMLPMLMALLAVVAELANYLAAGEAVEKGLRAGAMYAARSNLPLSGTATTNLQNLVKRGSLVGSDPYLTDSWNNGGTITATETTGTANGQTIDVITVHASVAYEELMPGVLGFLSLGPLIITLDHAQAYVGN